MDLTMAVIEAIGEPVPVSDKLAEVFENAWCAPEDADEICRLMRLPPGPASSLTATLGILHRHAVALSTLCDLLNDLVGGESVATLRGRKLSGAEKLQLHQARTAHLAQQFQEAVDRINDTLEKKIRDVAFLRLKCLGPPDPIVFFPPDAQRDIDRAASRGPKKLRRVPDRNYLYDVSRGAYGRILFHPSLRGAVFSQQLTEETASRLSESTRVLFALGSRDAHNDRPRYFLDHAQDISQAISFCAEMVEMLNDSVAQLLDASRAHMTFSEGVGLTASLQHPDGSYKERELTEARAKTVSSSLMDRLRRDRIRVPPIETAMIAVDASIEEALIVTLAAIKQGSVLRSLSVSPFFVDLALAGPKSGSTPSP